MSKKRGLAEKPFFLMNDLETMRAWDRIFESIEAGLLKEARRGKDIVVVAIALLVTATGQARPLYANEEAGDGEGKAPAEHIVARARNLLRRGEQVRLEFVNVAVTNDGSWSCVVRQGRGKRRTQFDDIWTTRTIQRYLAQARKDAEDIFLSVVVLSNSHEERRVALANCEFCDDSARRSSAEFVRRARRLHLLRRGERLDRIRIQLSNTNGEWGVRARPDPVRGEG
jgi:hypothetical protein